MEGTHMVLTIADVMPAAAEIFVAAAACVLLLVEATVGERGRNAAFLLAIAALAGAAWVTSEVAVAGRVVVLNGSDVECMRADRTNCFDSGRRAGECGDAGHVVQHGDPPHGAIVEERLAAEGRVDDHLHLIVQNVIDDVRTTLIHFEHDFDGNAMRAQVRGGAACRDDGKPEIR